MLGFIQGQWGSPPRRYHHDDIDSWVDPPSLLETHTACFQPVEEAIHGSLRGHIIADLSSQSSRYEFGQTQWTMVFQAGQKEGRGANSARHQLLVRYADAVYKYLAARLGDVNAAGELFSHFAERVLAIHPFLQRANPGRGRFRHYLRAILQRMVVDHHRGNQREKSKRRDLLVGSETEPVQPAAEPIDDDADFQRIWAEELMNQAWQGLEQIEKNTGKPYYTLMLYKAQNPAARSAAMAAHFTQELGRPLSDTNLRQMLHRGQEMLSDLLIAEIARSLREKKDEIVTADKVEEELINLKLLDTHRRKALDRFRDKAGS